MTNLLDKIKYFNYLCGEWDYRNIDMTDSHIAGIEIKNNVIEISCEKYSASVEEYLFSDGGSIKNDEIINRFLELNIEDRSEVLEFIRTLNGYVNWKKVDKDLLKEEQKLIKKYNLSKESEEELEQYF